MAQVHPTAIVSDTAVIGPETTVGPYSIIGPKVVLGKKCRVGPHVVLDGNTVFGDENTIFQFASIGAIPQDLKYRGEDSQLRIGDRNIIREFVTIQPGTQGGGMLTSIGDSNLFMANSHIGHDSRIGSNNVIANSVAIAGHVTIGDRVVMGGLAAVHQFLRIGNCVMIGGGAMVTQEIPPFCIAQGDRAKLVGINIVGMERAGLSSKDISEVKGAYRGFFFTKGSTDEKLERLHEKISEMGPAYGIFVEFLRSSQRGLAAPRKSGSSDE